MKLVAKIIAGTAVVALSACGGSTETDTTEGKPGDTSQMWKGEISLNDSTQLPFIFSWTATDTGYSMVIHNGGEDIKVTNIVEFRDSLKIQLPVFATYFWVNVEPEKMSGYFVNPDAENYLLPFEAKPSENGERFAAEQEPCCDLSGKWATYFRPNTESPKPAIGYFEQKGSIISGSFVTETGDYRYLQGVLSGTTLRLSTFDGLFLYLFEAQVGDTIRGHQYSGRSGYRHWLAYRDSNFSLRNPDSLTYVKKGYEGIDFAYRSLQGEKVTLQDEQFAGKALVVQIMGSWCPNCMDEARYLTEQYEKYHAEGLEIVGLTFELARDSATSVKRARKMKRNLALPYPVLMAGYTAQDKPEEALPMLNHIMSFPTSIYLNRKHEVVKIHTGFAGPGTPVYEEFVNENEKTFAKMLKK